LPETDDRVAAKYCMSLLRARNVSDILDALDSIDFALSSNATLNAVPVVHGLGTPPRRPPAVLASPSGAI
jgi:hypothetical protein